MKKKKTFLATFLSMNLIMSSAAYNKTYADIQTGTYSNSSSSLAPLLSGGYSQGGYKPDAARPTVLNWSGQSAYKGPEVPEIKWTYNDGKTYKNQISSPVIGFDGTVYTIFDDSQEGQLIAVNSNGAKKWSKALLFPNTSVFQYPVLSANNEIYVNASSLFGMDLNGNGKWAFPGITGWGKNPSVGSDGSIYIASDTTLFSLRPDGTEKWSYTESGYVIVTGNTPSIGSDGTIYTLMRNIANQNSSYDERNSSSIVALNPDGSKKWSYNFGNVIAQNISPAIGNNGTIYVMCTDVNSRNYLIYAINNDGTFKWMKQFPIDSLKSYRTEFISVDKDETIYLGLDNYLTALDANGEIKWKFDSMNTINGMPLIDNNGTVYFVSGSYNLDVVNKGQLFAVNSNGTKKWSMELDGVTSTTPAMAQDGTIYVTSTDGKIYAVGEAGNSTAVLQDMIISGENANIKIGQAEPIKAAACYSNGARKDITGEAEFISDNPQVAEVINGVVTGKSAGTAGVTIKYGSFVRKYSVTVASEGIPAVNPYENKDAAFLKAKELEAVNLINGIRTSMGLAPFSINEALSKSAQAHSNYKLINGDPFQGPHYEKSGEVGFTGYDPQTRAINNGYTGQVGEGIAREITPYISLEGLLAAPYHRLDVIDPNHTDIGVGFNKSGATVVDYGAPGSLSDDRVVQYPYPDQKDVPLSWFDNENPDPLAQYNLRYTYTGYPISVSMHDNNTIGLLTENVELKDSAGKNIDFYLNASTDTQSTVKYAFIIPKEPLQPGTTYEVHFKGKRIKTSGEEEAVDKQWQFTTQKEVKIRGAFFSYNCEKDSRASSIFLDIVPPGLSKLNYSIKSQDGSITYFNRNGNNYTWSQTSYTPTFEDLKGTYLLEVSTNFSTAARYSIEITDGQFSLEREIHILNRIYDKEDLDNDGNIDIKDIALAARSYNRKKTDTSYNNLFDMNEDGIIDIFDLVAISKKMI
ncbi:MAG: PQQ-binding-like beta-propeller repeat protein [Bacillota bacterium]|nr:PQQ-binding-like beta-propeller repeat protein [Bacillota bacterium]